MYTYTWKKYLPLIRLLLKRSVAGAQSVKLDSMDFTKGTRKSKPTTSFKIEIERGRMLTVSASVTAKQLFDTLQEDDIARQLIRENKYEISMNSDYELAIANRSSPSLAITDEIANGPDK